MTDNRELVLREDDYYGLLSFFLSSALLLAQAERSEALYPSLRLMDGASRLTEALMANGAFGDQAWPREFVRACETSLDLVMTDEDAFVEFLAEMTRSLAEEMKGRAGGA